MRFFLLCLAGLASAVDFEAIDFPICTPGETYFDVSALACLTCAAGQVPDPAGTGCVCAAGTVQEVTTDGATGVVTAVACVACPDGEAPTRDRTVCMPCNTTVDNDATCIADDPLQVPSLSGGECACAAGRVLVERDEHGHLLDAKRCRECPPGSHAEGSTCAACPGDHMTASSSGSGCECLTGCAAAAARLPFFWPRRPRASRPAHLHPHVPTGTSVWSTAMAGGAASSAASRAGPTMLTWTMC